MGNFEKKYVNAAFVAAFVILVVVNIVTYVNARIHLSGQNTINETFNEIQRSEVFLSSFSDAEANMRGYLITSRVNILELFYSSMKSTDSLYYKPKNEVNASSSKYDGFSLEINDEKILPGIDTAIPCGLIVNDL